MTQQTNDEALTPQLLISSDNESFWRLINIWSEIVWTFISSLWGGEVTRGIDAWRDLYPEIDSRNYTVGGPARKSGDPCPSVTHGNVAVDCCKNYLWNSGFTRSKYILFYCKWQKIFLELFASILSWVKDEILRYCFFKLSLTFISLKHHYSYPQEFQEEKIRLHELKMKWKTSSLSWCQLFYRALDGCCTEIHHNPRCSHQHNLWSTCSVSMKGETVHKENTSSSVDRTQHIFHIHTLF